MRVGPEGMQWLLIISGCIVIVACLAMIFVPYLRGTGDLLSIWSLFLFGVVNYLGVSAIQSGMVESHLYAIVGASEYWRFALGSIVFLLACSFAYYKFGWPRRAAARRFRKWTRQGTPQLLWLTVFSWLLVAGYLAVPNVQLLGQLLLNVGIVAAIFSAVFSFGAWYQRPYNTPLLMVAVACVIFALVVAISAGYGRRYLLSAALAVPICAYWLQLRYRPVGSAMIRMGVGAVAAIVLVGGYSAIRGGRIDPSQSALSSAVDRLKAIPGAFMSRENVADLLVGGDTTEASLAAIGHYSATGRSQPFHTVIYVLTNPIPRAWYPNKVGALGEMLPRDIGWWSRYGYVSWGVGIVGHGYYEGGLHMHVFYGLLIGTLLRFWDELLKRQSNNYVLLGIFCGCSAQVFALSRGELGLFIVLILGSWLTGLILNWVGRLLFGTEVYGQEWHVPAEAAYVYGEVEPAAAVHYEHVPHENYPRTN